MLKSRRKGWIGIDLGTRAVKIAQVERVGSHVRLAHARVIERTGPVESSGASHAACAGWDAAGQGIALQGFAGRRAACTLPMQLSDLRALNLPDGTDGQRRAMVASELESVFDSVAPRREFDYWNTNLPGGDIPANWENVGVLSVDQSDAMQVVDRLQEANLRCEVLDGLPLALARAVTMIRPPDDLGPVAAVDWGFSSATFCVVCDGRPVFTRYLRDCGFGALARAVMAALGLSADDVQQLLRSQGVLDPNASADPLRSVQEVIVDVASEPLAEMIAQLEKTLAYLRLHRSQFTPRRLVLMGGGATVRNIAGYLTSRIGLPTQVWTLPATAGSEQADTDAPQQILGAAIALSALAWVP